MLRILVLVAVFSAVYGCGPRRSDTGTAGVPRDAEEGAVREAKVELPGFPQDNDLIEFFPGRIGSHRYFIDGRTLAMGKDGVVRYAVVVKTAGGATNVAYEGIRCASGERRVYALGDRNRHWVEAKRSDWEPIRRGQVNEYRQILYADYFCPDRVVLPDRETALRALRSGRKDSEAQGSHL